ALSVSSHRDHWHQCVPPRAVYPYDNELEHRRRVTRRQPSVRLRRVSNDETTEGSTGCRTTMALSVPDPTGKPSVRFHGVPRPGPSRPGMPSRADGDRDRSGNAPGWSGTSRSRHDVDVPSPRSEEHTSELQSREN